MPSGLYRKRRYWCARCKRQRNLKEYSTHILIHTFFIYIYIYNFHRDPILTCILMIILHLTNLLLRKRLRKTRTTSIWIYTRREQQASLWPSKGCVPKRKASLVCFTCHVHFHFLFIRMMIQSNYINIHEDFLFLVASHIP
jgi:hypothetical protein